MLETSFPLLWIEGEISNFTTPSSGHWYFSLKDSKAQVRCAMFKSRSKSVNFTPKQGDKILIKARISLYEARGEYQLIAEAMEEAGFGELQRQFEALKQKLQSEGLFSPATKQTLPKIPIHIGVVTSPTGAAVKDILSVVKRRFPAIPVTIYPTLVQGESAAAQIAKAIDKANQHNVCDVIILARGGGSLEDLWAFNEEIVARAIFHSKIPIVSGVGHDIDVTIADFVADQRAPTPSAAAELVTPDRQDFLFHLENLRKKMAQHVLLTLRHKQTQLQLTARRLKHPQQQLMEQSQHLDHLEIRLQKAVKRQLTIQQTRLQQHIRLFYSLSPARRMLETHQRINELKQRLLSLVRQSINRKQQNLQLNVKTLNALNPLATLERGYSIVSHRNNNCIVRSYNEVEINEELDIKLNHGKLVCTVKESHSD